MEQGPRDYTGKLTYRTQDMRIWGFGMGSILDTSGTNSTHVLSEIDNDVRQSAFTSGTLNPSMSFTLEDSKIVTGTGKNFVRTINGVIPQKMTLKIKQGQPVVTELDYVAQAVTYSSGATTPFTSVGSNRPFLWADGTLTIGGSVTLTAKEIDFDLDQSTEAPHYINGSRVISVPFNTNRNYTVSVTLDTDSESVKPFYDQFFLGGSSFNVTLDLNSDAKAGVTGSQHAIISMSGCRMFDVSIPSPAEGVVEQTLTIRPQTVSITEYNQVVKYTAF